MATAATSLLGLALPVTGELSGTWGDTVNVSITALLDTAVAGTTTLSSDADVTLTTTTLAANQARQAIILWTAGGTATRTITVPAQSKSYIVINKTSSSQSIKIVGAGPTTGVTIVAGTAAFVVWNGVDFVTASVTSTTGILPVANGGTGLTAGTSGGVLAYTAAGTLASSTALAASALVIGGGAGAAPSTTTTGTGVVTALGVNTGTAGAFVVNGGALGTPSSGTVTNLTGTASININGTVGATTANTGAFSTLSSTGAVTLSGGTANGVAYLNASKVLTTGSALTFDGSNLGLGGSIVAGPLQITVASSVSSIDTYNYDAKIMSVRAGGIGGKISLFTGTTTTVERYSIDKDGIAVWTIGTEKMRLDSSGNLLVGTTTANFANDSSIALLAPSGYGIVNHPSGASSGSSYFEFGYNAAPIGSITQSGTTAVLYNTTSDQRLKNNIQDAAPASALIDSLQVRQFNWKKDNTHQRYGFVAQELVTVAPEAVHAPADPDEMMAVDYSKLVPLLVKELQSLRARVAQLESKT